MVKKNPTVGSDTDVVTEAPEAPVTEARPDQGAESPAPAASVPAEPADLAAADIADETLPEKDPGKSFGIIAIIVSFALGLAGIAFGLVSYRRSRAAGFGGGLGMAGMILGSVTTVLLALQLTLLATGMGFGGACEGRAPGVHTLDNGTRVSCR